MYHFDSELTLKAPITTKVVCFSRLLKCLRSLYGKQCGPRSDCSYRSSLFWVHTACFYTCFVSNVRQLFATDDFSRRHFQMHFFLGALRVKQCAYHSAPPFLHLYVTNTSSLESQRVWTANTRISPCMQPAYITVHCNNKHNLTPNLVASWQLNCHLSCCDHFNCFKGCVLFACIDPENICNNNRYKYFSVYHWRNVGFIIYCSGKVNSKRSGSFCY